jgi:hypothetical protein
MTEHEAYREIVGKAPTGYKMNELIPFSYPVRKIKMNILANKRPDGSLVKVYNVLLQAIQIGFHTQSDLFSFLGLGETDEFILRELFALREKGYVDLVSENWLVTESGEQFIKDNTILRVEEEEEFEFLIDEISGKIMSAQDNPTNRSKLQKYLQLEIKLPTKSPDLLQDKSQALEEVYKYEHKNEYLMSYNPEEIKTDYDEWCNYWLIEYVPEKNNSREPYLEVRTYNDLKENRELSAKFNSEYNQYIYTLTDSERKEIVEIQQIIETKTEEKPTITNEKTPFENLTIWKTKQKFIEALKTVKEQILIESPWIKRATLEYLPYFEKLLQNKKRLIILYGISDDAEHDSKTVEKVRELANRYKDSFTLIELPEHFHKINSRLKGTHRKLVIKDNDYFISGSFNFLSFAQNERQQVANEESMLISIGVEKKWESVIKEYSLKIAKPSAKVAEKPKEIISVVSKVETKSTEKEISLHDFEGSVNLNVHDVDATKTNSNETWFTKNTENPKRAVLELSTKAVKLLINTNQELLKQGNFNFDDCFLRHSDRTETGEGLNSNNKMSIEYFLNKVLPSISKFVNIAKSHNVDVLHTVATAAYRTATNRSDILNVIKKHTGINVQILSKQEEATSTLWAYIFSTKNKDKFLSANNIIMIDQGGGSTELSMFHKQQLLFSYSLGIGTTALKNILFSNSEMNLPDAFAKIEDYSHKIIKAELQKSKISIDVNQDYCVCVGRAVTIATGGKSSEQQHDFKLTIDAIKQVIESFNDDTYHKYRTVKDLRNMAKNDWFERKIVARVGLPVIIEILNHYGIDYSHVSGTGLWYGIFFMEYYGLN